MDAWEHVQDVEPKNHEHWHVFDFFHIDLPAFEIAGYTFQITKFMILELIAAALILIIYLPLARRASNGALPKGRWWNCFESLLTFVRDAIAKPNLGADADTFVPYLWTLFLFILFNNLLGMIPFFGSATASIWVTGALAICSFILFHAVPTIKMGPVGYCKAMWPKIQIDVPVVGLPLGLVISGGIFLIEMMGTAIKSFVLAVRLFANMLAGHMVLATILIFIYQVAATGNPALFGTVTFFSVVGQTALSLLELFVAFLQAYVFTFLTALFLGMSLHHGGEHHDEHGHEGHGETHGHEHAHGHAGHAHGH